MTSTRVIRTANALQLGQIIELFPPWPEEGGRWVVVEVTTDPNAVWKLTYDTDEPDASPDTYLVKLSAVR